MNTPPDDLAPLLNTTPSVPATATRREELLHATTRTLRRGMWVRRTAVATGVVGVFLAGGVAGWVLKPTAAPQFVSVPAPPTESKDDPQPRGPSAGDLELRAELSDDRAEVARLYREAGDRYLADEKDYAQAARCYRLHLQAADVEVRKVSAADSWLLVSMKETQ
jgi:uncharacterized membrane protein